MTLTAYFSALTSSGTLATLEQCDNALDAPLGYDASILSGYYGTWKDSEPCPCVVFAAGSNSVTYGASKGFLIESVSITASNDPDSFNTLDGVEVTVGSGACGEAISASSQGADSTVTCVDDSAQRGIEGDVQLSKNGAFEFCGFDAYGYYSPSEFYSEMKAQIDDAQEMYDDLTAKYDSMNSDYFTKYNAKTDLKVKYDELEDHYDYHTDKLEVLDANTESLTGRIENLGDQLLAVTDAYDLAVLEEADVVADNEVKDSNIASYSEASTMSEKCMIGPIFGWFWYCREGDSLVREEGDAEAEEEVEEEEVEE